jgi:hypothetical protein
MRRLLSFAVLIIACSGCAGWTRETKIEESAYQTLSAIDIHQSVNVANDPAHFWENGYAASACIGQHPSSGSQIAWGVARSAIHLGVTQMLVTEQAPTWAMRAWQIVTIADEGHTVGLNFEHGL